MNSSHVITPGNRGPAGHPPRTQEKPEAPLSQRVDGYFTLRQGEERKFDSIAWIERSYPRAMKTNNARKDGARQRINPHADSTRSKFTHRGDVVPFACPSQSATKMVAMGARAADSDLAQFGISQSVTRMVAMGAGLTNERTSSSSLSHSATGMVAWGRLSHLAARPRGSGSHSATSMVAMGTRRTIRPTPSTAILQPATGMVAMGTMARPAEQALRCPLSVSDKDGRYGDEAAYAVVAVRSLLSSWAINGCHGDHERGALDASGQDSHRASAMVLVGTCRRGSMLMWSDLLAASIMGCSHGDSSSTRNTPSGSQLAASITGCSHGDQRVRLLGSGGFGSRSEHHGLFSWGRTLRSRIHLGRQTRSEHHGLFLWGRRAPRRRLRRTASQRASGVAFMGTAAWPLPCRLAISSQQISPLEAGGPAGHPPRTQEKPKAQLSQRVDGCFTLRQGEE